VNLQGGCDRPRFAWIHSPPGRVGAKVRRHAEQYNSEAKQPQVEAQLAARSKLMPDWVWVAAFFVAYIVVTQWLLPKLGVPT
jgi:hypothetical protein